MKPESLHALFIDRELGELSPETVELLEAWLAEHPESARAAPSIQRAIDTASATVRRFPELARPQVTRSEHKIIPFPTLPFRFVPVALAASILILLTGTAWIGFRMGEQSAHQQTTALQPTHMIGPKIKVAKPEGPWARYALASDPRGGLTVVRRDSNVQP